MTPILKCISGCFLGSDPKFVGVGEGVEKVSVGYWERKKSGLIEENFDKRGVEFVGGTELYKG